MTSATFNHLGSIAPSDLAVAPDIAAEADAIIASAVETGGVLDPA